MVSKFPSQEMDRFNVRLPNGMRDAIAERAKENGRSMNAEIVQILEDALSSKQPRMFVIEDEAHRSTIPLDEKYLEELFEKAAFKALTSFTAAPQKKSK